MTALTPKQEELCARPRGDFSDLRAVYINCTLERSPGVSNAQGNHALTRRASLSYDPPLVLSSLAQLRTLYVTARRRQCRRGRGHPDLLEHGPERYAQPPFVASSSSSVPHVWLPRQTSPPGLAGNLRKA